MAPGIGHNSNRTTDGYAGRLHLWRRARTALTGARLPVEVVRLRMRRAAALGLDFSTYASIRAATGRDVVALLFSSNAVGMLRRAELDARAADRLAAVAAQRGVLVHRPLPATAPPPLDWAARAPAFTDPWTRMREIVSGALSARGLPGDAVVMIGATAAERDWCAAARAAGWIHADAYFGRGPAAPDALVPGGDGG